MTLAVHRLALVGILATLSACTPKPEQRSWVLHTEDEFDDQGRRYTTYAEVRQMRAAAISTRGEREAFVYLRELGRFLWEIEPLLAARDRIAEDPDLEYAAIDPNALVAEAEAFLAEFEAAEGPQPYLWSLLAFVQGDCKSVSVETAFDLSCQLDGFEYGFDVPKAVCGDITTVCRETLDRITRPEAMYLLLDACAESMTKGTEQSKQQALASWLSPAELEFWREMDARPRRETAVREPEPPAITRMRRPPQIYATVFENQCDKPVRVIGGNAGWQTVGPGKRVVLEIRRCYPFSIGPEGSLRTWFVTRPLGLRLEADCKDVVWVRPGG